MEQQPQEDRFLQLIDEEEWFNLHGLRNDNNNARQNLNDRELSERVANEISYQQTISNRIFAQEDARNDSKTKRQQMIQKWKNKQIDVHFQSSSSNENEILSVNLGELASRSDTVFAMASTTHLYQQDDSSNSNIKLSLLEYSKESVQAFFEAVLSTNDTSIPPEYVIDCCRLAHYLQCRELLDSIVENYLLPSMDHENCRFLCKLADELSLPSLWEASVNHMLSSLDKLEEPDTTIDPNSNPNSNSSLWEDLSPALKTEIQALRGILKSSRTSQVYFSTYHEYLALLAEQVQYYRERLEDAQDSQKVRAETEARLRTQLETLLDEKKSLGSWYGSARLDNRIADAQQRLEGLVKGNEYAASKIQRQQERVKTLRAIWKEQKQVFGGGGSNDDDGFEEGLRFEKRN